VSSLRVKGRKGGREAHVFEDEEGGGMLISMRCLVNLAPVESRQLALLTHTWLNLRRVGE
jgi:hypothetical protein